MSTTVYSFDLPDEHLFYAMRDAIGQHWFSLEEAAVAFRTWIREYLENEPQQVNRLTNKSFCGNVRNILVSVTWAEDTKGDWESYRFCGDGCLILTLTWEEQRAVCTDVPNKTVVIEGVEYVSTTKEPQIKVLGDWTPRDGTRTIYLSKFQVQGTPK